jgi:hypothetical protein
MPAPGDGDVSKVGYCGCGRCAGRDHFQNPAVGPVVSWNVVYFDAPGYSLHAYSRFM